MKLNEIKSKLLSIFEGYSNLLIKKTLVETVAETRKSVCDECPFKKGLGCGVCGCVLEAKTRSLIAVCPTLKWRAVIPINIHSDTEIILDDNKSITIKKGSIRTVRYTPIPKEGEEEKELTYHLITDDYTKQTIKVNSYKINNLK